MNWLGRLFRKRKLETQLDSELRFHLEQRTADLVAAGVEPAEAHRRAMIEFGGVERAKEECREARGTYFLETLAADIRYGWRMLRKSPGFTIVAVLTLALGIGANLTMIGILNAWLFEPLPFPHSNRIVIANLKDAKRPNEPPGFAAYRDLLAWHRATGSFSSMAGAFWQSYILTGAGSARRLFGMIVTKDFFSTLGVQPELGRTFRRSDLRGPPTVVLSDSLWREDFGASSTLLGRPITLSGKPYFVIGVMPRSFDFRISNQPKGAQLWTLIRNGTPGYGPNGQGPIAAIGRLRRGVSPAGAQTELSVIFRRIESAFPGQVQHLRVSVVNLRDFNTAAVRSSLLLGEAAVAFLFLIACANLAGLLLARGAWREKEMAVRVALGSSRGRLIRQLFTESAIIALLGTGGGILVAEFCFRWFQSATPLGTLPPQPIGLDGHALIVAGLLAVLTAALVAFPPALRASQANPADGLRAGSRLSSAGHRAARSRRVLVVGEIAVAVVLVTGAVLLTQTLLRLLRQPLGFATNHVTMLTLSLPGSLTATAAKREDFYSRLAPAMEALPGMESVGISKCSLLYCGETPFRTESSSPSENSGEAQAAEQAISPGFFSTLRIPLLRGRTFTRSDDMAAVPVAILNRSAARAFGAMNPINQRVRLGKKGRWRTVVGIAGDTRSIDYSALGWQTQPRIYIPLAQASSANSNPVGAELFVTLRGRGRWTDRELRRAVASASEQVPIAIDSLHGIIAEQFRQSKFRAVFLSCFGLAGLLLAALGVYGIVAQMVSWQTREIGIRVALGAQTGDVLRLVVGQGTKLVLTGVAIGLAATSAATRLMRGLLYGVTPTDPLTFTGVSILLVLAGLAACYIPARRATRVDPVVALRQE